MYLGLPQVNVAVVEDSIGLISKDLTDHSLLFSVSQSISHQSSP
jgi:hypothetical protein